MNKSFATLSFLLLAGLTIASGLSSCGYFYTATVQGYIVDSNANGGTTGINNATVWLYEKDPGAIKETDTAGPDGFFAKTATAAQGNNNGFYSAKVVWNNPTGKYGEEGDTTTFWIVVTQENYKTTKFSIPGILSKSTNTVPDLSVKRATFTATTVKGQVKDASGNGVNGIRVVLTLYPSDADPVKASNEDYVVNTATPNGGAAGTYTFTNVTWKNAASTAVTDTHTVNVRVVDPQYTGNLALSPSLTSGSDNTLTDVVTVTHKPRTQFTATLQGRVQSRSQGSNGATMQGVQGVSVTVTYRDNGNVLRSPPVVQTNANGTWAIQLDWTDTAPGRYFDGTAGTADASIPVGDDGLVYTVKFEGLPTKQVSTKANLTEFSGLATRSYTGTVSLPADATVTYAAQKLTSTNNPTLFPDGILDLQ